MIFRINFALPLIRRKRYKSDL